MVPLRGVQVGTVGQQHDNERLGDFMLEAAKNHDYVGRYAPY